MTPAAPGAAPARRSLTPRMAWQLAAPHTWPAAIMPVMVAAGATTAVKGGFSPLMAAVLLVICILMQASVNTFNDYFDYVKGADSAEDNVEESDAVLVYNDVSPKAALWLAVGFLAVALGLGCYVISQAGWVPLAIGLVGGAAVALYSGGRNPLSYLPVGELVSGLVMGGLIALASYQALTGRFEPLVLAWSVPSVIGIGLIMMTNNTCDIEKDEEAKRRTLPVLLGRRRARSLYHGLMIAWIASIVLIVRLWFPAGFAIMVFMVLAVYPLAAALWKNPLAPASRIGAMAQISSLNVVLGAFYAAALML